MTIAPLAAAGAEETYGGKAAALARAIGAALPVPDGFAVGWETVSRAANGDAEAQRAIVDAFRAHPAANVAVRSSAVGEDSLDASFAGQHVTVLNVLSDEMLLDAVRTIHASARAESALEYRRRMGVTGEPKIAVVVQRLIDADAAGVLFTRNPMTGADERVIESAWGLGEAVVAGLVTPDRFRIAKTGTILSRDAGRKDVRVRRDPNGGVVEQPVPETDIARLSLNDAQLMELPAANAERAKRRTSSTGSLARCSRTTNAAS
ncbi:MAG TPA: PEP/pyruvate-binding domain-containing protein, partial [Thermoanaerobaculia bacterium]|nr:PEP/pyruvate-binding domain-containing protein [Thermoanaerobaculia bacterium]